MRKSVTFLVISLALSLALTGCRGPRVLRDGFVLGESQWSKDENELRTRSAFELDCAKELVTLQVLSEEYDGYAMSVGVAGCGKRLVFKRLLNGGGWAAN